jgi:HTH-type transcriptional regulator, transcriptional repressor of NAD biosynthesis genes
MMQGIKLICFFGPESTGKTVLVQHLANRYKTVYVPEVAREMIASNDFTAADIVRIGKAQTERVLQKIQEANKILFCDTDVITTQIYSRQYLNLVPEVLYDLEKQIRYDHYFLFHPDVPWIADGMRDLKDRRLEMFETFKSELDKRKIPYTNVQGTYSDREKIVVDHVTAIFLTFPTR